MNSSMVANDGRMRSPDFSPYPQGARFRGAAYLIQCQHLAPALQQRERYPQEFVQHPKTLGKASQRSSDSSSDNSFQPSSHNRSKQHIKPRNFTNPPQDSRCNPKYGPPSRSRNQFESIDYGTELLALDTQYMISTVPLSSTLDISPAESWALDAKTIANLLRTSVNRAPPALEPPSLI